MGPGADSSALCGRAQMAFCIRGLEEKGRSFVEQDKGPAVPCGIFEVFRNELPAFSTENRALGTQGTVQQKSRPQWPVHRSKIVLFRGHQSVGILPKSTLAKSVRAESMETSCGCTDDTHDLAQRWSYSSRRRHQAPVSLRPLGCPRSSHWYMPQRPLISITGWGQFGPYSSRPGYDPIAQAVSVFMSLNGSADGPPTKDPMAIADQMGGLHGAISVRWPRCAIAMSPVKVSMSTLRCWTP
jgi:CoA-transferase family III